MIEMQIAMIKRSAKDLGDDKAAVRGSAAGYFLTDDFENFCKENALPHKHWMESVQKIIKEDGVRKKKLIGNFLKEVKEFL